MNTLEAALEFVTILNSGISNALHVARYPEHNRARLRSHITGIVDRLNALLEEMAEEDDKEEVEEDE